MTNNNDTYHSLCEKGGLGSDEIETMADAFHNVATTGGKGG
jgi:hypothetical protein